MSEHDSKARIRDAVLVRHLGYRQFKPGGNLRLLHLAYKIGDTIDQFHKDLVKSDKKNYVDNHSGWLVSVDGEYYVYYFSNWTFSVYKPKPELVKALTTLPTGELSSQ